MFSKANAETYFTIEKSMSLLFLLAGLAAIVVAIVLWLVYKSSFCKGLALPLILIGIAQAVVGYTVYSRSDKQRTDIVYKMYMDPAAIKTKEVPRMEKVMKRFKIYRYVEIIMLVAGVGLVVYHLKLKDQQFWMGIGMGLAIQAGLLLIGDGFAESRGIKYLQGLRSFTAAAQ